MANKYHDETGRFCSRDQMRSALNTAAANGNVTVWMELKKSLTEADAETNYMPSKRSGLINPANKNLEQDIVERDRIINEGTTEELQQWFTDRTNNPNFVKLLDDKDVMQQRAISLDEEHKLMMQQEAEGLIEFEVVRQKGEESQDAWEEYVFLREQSNIYKDVTAIAAATLADKIMEQQKEDGTWREFDAETLNDLTVTGEFASGSREWLEQRQHGIGGSDVGKIIGNNEDRALNLEEYKEILGSKLDPITDEEVETQENGHISFSGYAGRGNAWEMLIAQKFGENNPNLNLTHCKTSWKNKHNPYQFANFDGLMTDENGHPNGIVEIKTAGDPSKWGDPALGLDAVPPGYRAQTLWYADAAGFNKGAIAVMINDREYREYHFTVTPELKQEMLSNRQKVEEFVETVQKIKNGEIADPRTPRNISGRQKFGVTFLANARKNKDEAFKEAAVLREESIEETKQRFNELCVDLKDPEAVSDALHTLYTEKPMSERKQKFINLDIETTAMKPTRGHIIEVGVSVRNPDGSGETEKFAKLYGVPKRVLASTGLGAVEVHNITEGKIAKKRSFSHPQEQKRVLDLLKSGTLVAHNASFEVRWLRQKLKGFAEAEKAGQINVLDTRSLTQKFLTTTENTKLSSFVEHYGIPYENAHRAYNDALMMGKGLDEWLKQFTPK